MTLFKWVIKSLVHYRRIHIAVALAAAIATATLTGALFVGDSVKATLKYAFVSRLGKVDSVISARERFFRQELSQRLKEKNIESVPVLQLQGMVTKGDGSIRVNQVRVLGVNDDFFKMSLAGEAPGNIENEKAVINSALAYRLKIRQGEDTEVVLRFDKPSAISRNLVLAPNKDNTISMRLSVSGIADDDHFGRFSLEANQQEPLNLFVPISWLGDQIDRAGKANLMLITNESQNSGDRNIYKALKQEWRLKDAGVDLETVNNSTLELTSSKVFIDPSVSTAALNAQKDAAGILTYFVNELRVKESFTPYSMVTAAEVKGAFKEIFPDGMSDEQIVINQWLADDLGAEVGDTLTLKYFVPGGWESLEENQRSFTICRIIPIKGIASDRTLMPNLPGLSDPENCSDWDPSLPINLTLIRDKDEAYWDNYRGTPKAFITLSAGQKMWSNTYGNLTAVRFKTGLQEKQNIAEKIRMNVDPASVGLSVIPVKEQGARASRGGTDFGQLFLGLSMFLIFSAVLLTWLLFVFSIEGRKNQTGMLLAIGFPVKRVRKLYLYEGLIIALIGAFAGSLIAVIYTKVIVWGLSNAWQGAVAGMSVRYSVSFESMIIGFLAGFLIAFMAMIRTLHKQMKSSAHSLLSGSDSADNIKKDKPGWLGWPLSLICLLGALILIISSKSLGSSAMAGAFFGAGALLLISIMIFIRVLLLKTVSGSKGHLTSLNSLALQNSARRRGRSMAVIAMLACGVFMVAAVSANRKNPEAGAEIPSSGTGGFSLYSESSVPVVQNLNSVQGRETWGLDTEKLNEVRFVSLRVRHGDDASCLNLNRTQEPKILGVSQEAFTERGSFSFQDIEDQKYKNNPWEILKQESSENIIPAVGDYPTVYWGLGKKTGDILVYQNRKGEEIKLRIAGMIKSSVLQGSLLISDENMAKYFPEVEGYGAWLIDTPPNMETEISEHITQRMSDAGISVETTIERLELFARMEDTYLSIFLILGGLGLILGCIGLGLIVARNLLERQGELAMLRAVGFRRGAILKMVCYEHIYLLAAGIAAGLLCAAVSVMPSIQSAGEQLPFGLIALMTLLTAASGVIWVVVSTKSVLRGDILTPLRNE